MEQVEEMQAQNLPPGMVNVEITVVSARALPVVGRNYSFLQPMNPFTEVTVPGVAPQRTCVHRRGGTSPEWDCTLTFTCPSALIEPLPNIDDAESYAHPHVLFRLYHQTIEFNDHLIAVSSIPLHYARITDGPRVTHEREIRRIGNVQNLEVGRIGGNATKGRLRVMLRVMPQSPQASSSSDRSISGVNAQGLA